MSHLFEGMTMHVVVLSGLGDTGQLERWKLIFVVGGLKGNLAQHFDFNLTIH